MEDAGDAGTLPTQQLLIRTQDDFEKRSSRFSVRTGDLTPEELESGKANEQTLSSEEGWLRYSEDGRMYANILNESVDVYDSATNKVAMQIERAGVTEVKWSPRGTFLVTWERRQAEDEPQLRIWSIIDNEVKEVRALHLKKFNSEVWPVLRWTEDEELLFHLNTNQVTVYSGRDCNTKLQTLAQKGLAQFALAPTSAPYQIATFVPVSGAAPARVSVYEYPNLTEPQAVKSFFKASSAELVWSPIGYGVLIKAKTEVDKTNASYYGESSLHLLMADGSFSCTVPFNNNKGPVHDAQWSPQGKDFMVLQGFQPARAILFNALNCVPVRDFGKQSRNTILFSPHGRFVCLAGFGNLAGEMDFWDKNKLKLMGSCQDMNGAKSFEWTPCGRHFVTSVLWPKRRVDNGFKVWTYYGELVYAEFVEKLAQVALRPAEEGVFPNRPMSPRLSDKRLQQSMIAKQNASKPKSYVPPHLRGKTDAPSNIMKREAEPGPRKLCTMAAKADELARPDATSKAEKNKKRRERAKQKKEEEAKAAKETEERRILEEKAAKETLRKQEEQKRADLPPAEALAKKLKQLKKKVGQVDKLQALKDSGTELDKSQRTKLATGVALRKELAEVEAGIAAL